MKGVGYVASAIVGAGLVGLVWLGTAVLPARVDDSSPKRVVERLYAAFNSGDIPSIRKLIAPDATWIQYGPKEILPFAGMRRGPDGVMSFFADVDRALENPRPGVREFIVAGDKVAVPGTEESTVRSTGIRYHVNNLHLFTVRNGKVVSFEEFIDSGTMVLAFTNGKLGSAQKPSAPTCQAGAKAGPALKSPAGPPC